MTIFRFSVLPSTNDEAFGRAEAGAPEWSCFVAETQTAGRGRLDRHWFSQSGNLYASIILRPKIIPSHAPQLNFVAALAVDDTLRFLCPLSGLEMRLKWPNDVWIKQKKIAGILTELAAEGNRVKFVVLGIGINVNQKVFSNEISTRAISLFHLLHKKISVDLVLNQLLAYLKQRYGLYCDKGFSPIQKEWEEKSKLLGKKVMISDPNQSIEGIFQGLSDDGALLLKDDKQHIHRIYTGDLTW